MDSKLISQLRNKGPLSDCQKSHYPQISTPKNNKIKHKTVQLFEMTYSQLLSSNLDTVFLEPAKRDSEATKTLEIQTFNQKKEKKKKKKKMNQRLNRVLL